MGTSRPVLCYVNLLRRDSTSRNYEHSITASEPCRWHDAGGTNRMGCVADINATVTDHAFKTTREVDFLSSCRPDARPVYDMGARIGDS